MIPQLLLEEIIAGEKKAEDYYEKYGKENLDSALSELKASNEEILSEYPVEEMQQSFVKKSIFAKNGKIHKPRYVWIMAAAAVLATALVMPVTIKNSKTNTIVSENRVKGASEMEHHLNLYRKEGRNVFVLKNGDYADENDSVQIAYVPGQFNYGVIFSFDGNGTVTKHFPEDDWVSGKLVKSGEEVPLPFSYVLDDAPDFECFVFVASKKPFDMSDFGRKCESKKVKKNRLTEGFYIPRNCSESVFVLNK